MAHRLHSTALAVAASTALLLPLAASPAFAGSTPSGIASVAGDITPAAATADGQLTAADLAYPGTSPGDAQASLDDGTLTLSNAVISATFTKLGGTEAHLASVSGENGDLGISSGTLFTITLANGTKLTPANTTIATPAQLSDLTADPQAPAMADQESGKSAQVTYSYTADGNDLTIVWSAQLRKGGNNVQTAVEITNNSDSAADIASIELLDLNAAAARVDGNVDGSPIVFGAEGSEEAFAGLEHPMAKTTISGQNVDSTVSRSSDLEAGLTWTYSHSVGVTPPGQLRRAFTYYIERERAHARRTFLHYQSWFDLKPQTW